MKKLFYKKCILSIVSLSLIHSQLLSAVFMASVLTPKTASAYDEIIPPKNIKDNPIKHIEVDPNSGKTHLDRAQNGTPVININAASKGGVSVNYYRDFNINEENVIFNNYKGEAANSVLGGSLHGNPNFNPKGAKAADIILNEVTSGRITNINGYAEVFGKKADLIIANPNGIMVSGAGFINTNRVSLITGKSSDQGTLDANGNLNPFMISENPNAVITVVGRNITDAEGKTIVYNLGIDATNSNYVDLISRVVKINGDIYASEGVNIKTGNDKATYNKTTKEFDVSSTDKGDKPEFAIDSTVMGGIYAGRISLIATEQGVGVRTRSDLVASVEDIKFDVKGNIVLGDTGSVHARRNVTMSAAGKVTNDTIVVAEESVQITADDVQNNDQIYAADSLTILSNSLQNDGAMLTGTGDTTLKSGTIVNAGEISSGGALTIVADDLNNDQGALLSHGKMDISFNNPTDYTLTGVIYTNDDFVITAENITNMADMLAANNIIFNAAQDIFNGDGTTSAALVAFNNAILNAGGSLYNYGSIVANNTIVITAGDSVYNGLAIGSDARINAGANLVVTAGNSIVNKGYLQSLGNVYLKSNAAINDDYQLGDTVIDLGDLDTTKTPVLTPEAEALLNDLANITDLDVLYALMSEVISEEQFNAVQDRILIVKIKSTLDDFVDDRTFDMSDYLDLDEDEILELMQNLLTDEYDEADWKIDLSTKEAAIDQLIAAQFGRYNDYVAAKESAAQTQYNTDKEAARQQYIIDNGNDSGFTWPAFSFTAPSLSDYVAATPGEDVLDKPQYMQDAAQAAQEERFDRIKDITDAQVSKAGSYDTINWLSLTDEELNEKLEDLLGEEYDVMDWMRLTYIPRDVAQEITQEYLGSLRIDADKIKNVEKTGIHNYGRIYSGNDMLLESNSVVHNNKGSLIYSEGDMTFLVNKVLFNNENAIGQGILSKGNLNIMGNGTDENGNPTSLEKLLNYDGRIEADLNITIKAKDTVNYGSDSIDLSKIDNTIQPLNQYWYTVQECKRTFRGGKRCSMVNYYITEEEYNTRKDNGDTNLGMQWTGYYYVKDYPELDDAHDLVYVKDADPWLYKTVQSGHDKVVSYVTSNASSIQSNQGTVSITGDNVVNYNSTIFGDNVVIQTQNLLNTALQYNVNAKIYYTYKGKKCKWHGGSCKTYTNTWTTPTVLTVEGDKSAGIVARNALVISAQTIGNGTASVGDFSTNMPLPYDSGITYEDIVDHISKTGTINPADHIALPSGDYGIFRKPSDPDSKFLYETDPTLVDLSQFLGSEYFMNRISEDPFTHDLKFLGDSYFEHEMIKKSLEQIPLFQHSSFSDAEITRFINSLYSAVSEDLVSQLNLEFGKELTAEQINALEHDIVWYVKQTITLPDGSETEALVPMVYFSQGTINAMAAESNKIGDMQKELSAKQASDIATVQGTQAGNKAVQTELDRVSGEATKEAAAHLKSPEVMQDISDKTMAYMQENAHIVDQNVTSGYARYLDDKEANKDNANWKDPYVGMSEDAIKESMKQSVEGAMQKAFTDNYTEEIRSAKYNELYAQKLDTVDQEGIYKTAYDTAYEGAYQGAYDKALAQNQSNQNSSSVLRGNDIYIASLDPTATSVLNNAGMIAGGRQVAIYVDQINNITSTLGGNQASIFSGDVLYLNTKNDALGTDGTINNASGFMGTLNQGSLVYLETGELNNLTQSQTAVVDGKGKQFEYHKVDTTLGSTAMIASSGDMIVDTTGDLNMVGAALTATNSALIDVGGNLTSATAVDYDYEYQKTKRSGGMLGESLKKIDITESNTNYASTISAGEHLSIDVGDKLIGVGTHISAGGDLNISADSIALFNAMDTDYEYAFEHRERFDLASAAANVGAAVAAAAVTGGAGAAVVAGAAAASGAMGMKKGSTDIS
ncbi:MAG: filamentous hemagglutinin N-terminal domain-containing protein, partial [Lactobacillales bacterium]|nr:filamentous hemagglutinin N-terminal domain-containing protein [Lactobacillales bacterium]